MVRSSDLVDDEGELMEELIVVENHEGKLLPQTNNQLVMLENQIKQLTETRDKLRALIKDEMEKYGIYKLESDEVSITYIDETERETFDSKTFKKEHPGIYGEYVKKSKVASSVRIKVK